MVIAVDEVGVDASFLESCFNGFVHLFFFCFFNSNVVLRLDDVSGYSFAVNSHGIHSGNLHCNVAHNVLVYAGFVESNDCREFVTEVVVSDNRFAFEAFVCADFCFFAGFAGFLNNEFCNGATVHGEGFEFLG